MKKFFLLFSILGLIIIGCGGKKDEVSKSPALNPMQETELFQKANTIFGKLPDKMPGSEADTPELIALGKKLYFETSLSGNGKQSCNSCHDINTKAGVDGLPTSPGAFDGKSGTRNSPTVLNAGFQFVQFWDGRAKDLKEQAKGPILNPVEMSMKSDKDVEKIIGENAEYKELFAKVYPGIAKPVTYDNLANAIAAFERTLISKSRFDTYLAGNKEILTVDEKQGMKLFMETGCITCHISPMIGGSMYQKMGLVQPYTNTKDLGRFDVTKNEADKFMFKVAPLRNVSLTAPYFHDGAVASLSEAIKTMASINLGKQLKDDEINLIKAFIGSLSDEKLEKSTAKK